MINKPPMINHNVEYYPNLSTIFLHLTRNVITICHLLYEVTNDV